MCTAEGLLLYRSFGEQCQMPFGILFAILGACVLANKQKT